VSHKDLPAIDNISQWDATVNLPLLHNAQVIHEDNKIVGAALVEDLRGAVVGTRHF
jgi:hypothetical protein